MIDINPLVVATLKTIGLPVTLEKFVATMPIPCISYTEYSNRDTLVGNTIEYSEIITMVKVWSDSLGVRMSNAILIDKKMKLLGYKKDFGGDLTGVGTGQYILRYKGIAKDEII